MNMLAPTTTTTPDPLLDAYHAWLEAREDWFVAIRKPGAGNFDTPECLEAEARQRAAESEMLRITPSSPEGIAALVSLIWLYAGPDSTDPEDLAEDLQNQEVRALMRIWRACTGRSGFPRT